MDRPKLPYVKRLPVEIWSECFNHLGMREYLALTTTCRLFYDLCHPLLFKTIHCVSKLEVKKNHTNDDVNQQLSDLEARMNGFRTISNNPRLASLVKECSLFYGCKVYVHADEKAAQAVKDAYTPFVDTFTSSFIKFTNLRHLHVEFRHNLDRKILVALASLPRLEDLIFKNVKFGVHKLQPLIKVQNLTIDNRGPVDSDGNPSAKKLDLFSVEILRRLNIWSPTYASKVFQSFCDQAQKTTIINLVSLDLVLREPDVGTFYVFLKYCPKLTQLALSFHKGEDIVLDPLHKAIIPALQEFKGPDLAARAFVPGRPVWSAYLTSDKARSAKLEENRATIIALSESAAPITDLCMPWLSEAPELSSLISTHLPNLKKVHWRT
ncbi:hypothetical protein CVT26_000469 [Gymnopilus dilepis]|uniref:F-box domain-containing protein n=1 Tax=Gymnopilus dilepis TaxID=231916 RepID=A0A409Y2J4_9AGAR|nr:hypothetical protein CVT26_000469 [Gymnopilus dilepis]